MSSDNGHVDLHTAFVGVHLPKQLRHCVFLISGVRESDLKFCGSAEDDKVVSDVLLTLPRRFCISFM